MARTRDMVPVVPLAGEETLGPGIDLGIRVLAMARP